MGKIVRKSLPEIRAMRMLVHDSRFQPQDANSFPRWQFRSGTRDPSLESGWIIAGRPVRPHGRRTARLGRAPIGSSTSTGTRRSGRYGPVRDFYGYNGGDLGADNDVGDLGMEARLCVSEAVDAISVALRSGSDQFVVRIPVGGRGSIELLRNNQRKLADKLPESF